MFKVTAIHCLTALALTGSSICLSPSMASADTGDTTPTRITPWNNTPANNDSNYRAVYDISPAAAQAAYAQAAYDRAYFDFVGSADRARAQFNVSNDHRQAVKAVENAQADYESAVEPVLNFVHNQPAYTSLMEKRARVESALKSGELTKQDQVSFATVKMEYGAQAGRMEANALNNDSNVRQAKAKLQDAREALENQKAQFEVAIYSNPEVVAAKHAFDAATMNLTSAQAYFQGALLARSDTVDADNRRYPPTINNIGWNPYSSDYYGVGNGYYGRNLSVVHFNQQ